MENVENKILEVLEDVGEKMAPVIKVIMMMIMMTNCTMIMMTMSFSFSKLQIGLK